MSINRIAVVGSGLMGKGICHSFALFGYKVDVFGRRDDIKEEITGYFKNELAKGRITPEQKDTIFKNINIYNMNLQPERFSDSDLIIETVKEDFETKKEVFALISKYAKAESMIASNTSSYSITKLSNLVSKPERFLGMHFFSPVPLMKLVEIIKGEQTDDAAIYSVCEVVKTVDKLPVEIKDSPGFVLNRGLLLLLNEAVYMLSEKIANSVEDIDNVFVNGMSMKVGPLRLIDLIGVDVVYSSVMNLYNGFNDNKYKPCPLLKQMVDEGLFGKKTGKGFYMY